MSKGTSFAEWLDSRMPTLKREWNRHMAEYYAPKNFNFWYYFGVLSMVVLVIQLVNQQQEAVEAYLVFQSPM